MKAESCSRQRLRRRSNVCERTGTGIARPRNLARFSQLESREFEIILVNDGSPDATWDVVQRMHLAHPSVRGINLMRNYGQHGALLAGIFNARYEAIVTLDDDFQTPADRNS